MKKHIVTSLSILILFVLLSGNALQVSATGGTCSVPSCRPKPSVATPAPVQDTGHQARTFAASPENAFNFAFFLERWVMSSLYLL